MIQPFPLFFSLVHFSPVSFCVPSFNFHFFFLSPTLLSQSDAVLSSLFCHLSRLYFFSSFSLHPVLWHRAALVRNNQWDMFCSFGTIFQADRLWFMCPSPCLPEGHRAKHKRCTQSSISFFLSLKSFSLLFSNFCLFFLLCQSTKTVFFCCHLLCTHYWSFTLFHFSHFYVLFSPSTLNNAGFWAKYHFKT